MVSSINQRVSLFMLALCRGQDGTGKGWERSNLTIEKRRGQNPCPKYVQNVSKMCPKSAYSLSLDTFIIGHKKSGLRSGDRIFSGIATV
jgi:hypothetical protein